MSEQTPEELKDLVRQLTERMAELEGQVASLRKQVRVPEDEMVAIAAAVAAFMGHKAKIKAVRFSNSRGWAAEGRGRVHNRAVPHVR